MILDYAYNKGLRKLSVSYVRDDGHKALMNFNVDRFKSFHANTKGPYTNWDGRPCEIQWVSDPDKFDIKTYIEEISPEKKAFRF